MATTAVGYTVEEFEVLNLGDDRFEQWWGEVRLVSGGGREHSGIGRGIGASFVRSYGRGALAS